jgi:hypothetical protein
MPEVPGCRLGARADVLHEEPPPADTPRWDATTAIEGLYRPRWCTEILAELEYHETQKLINRGQRPDAAAARAPPNQRDDNRFRRRSNRELEPRDGAFNLPDPTMNMWWQQR